MKKLKFFFEQNWIDKISIINECFKQFKYMGDKGILEELKIFKDYFGLNQIHDIYLDKILYGINILNEKEKDFLNINSIYNINNRLYEISYQANIKYLSVKNNDKIYNNQNKNNSKLNEEILDLKNELNNKNQIIEQQESIIDNLQIQLNSLNKFNDNNQIIIKNLQKDINMKQEELMLLKNELKNKNEELNKLNCNNNKSEKNIQDGIAFAVNFRSLNQDIVFPIPCRLDDTIVKLEEILYNEYPKYKDYETYLTANGKMIKRFKTIEENGIKKGNTILINIYE